MESILKSSESIVSLDKVCVSYFGNTILSDLSLSINEGEFLTLLGPSGCGKTTILRLIGGFLEPDSGKIFFKEKDITNLPPHKREVNTIFQKYALFPHLNVFENVAFGLRVQKKSEDEVREVVTNMLETVSLSNYAHRSVTSLSGGQQQRVAIARALANKPKVLLLDEPLAALDLKLRKDMQSELKKIQKQTGITFIFVTHDQEEALSMSDRVVVMDGGIIQQIGSPTDIYNEPKNAFVADFIGESNILPGKMISDFVVRIFHNEFECLDKGFEKNENVDVVIRPEDISICSPEDSRISGVVTMVTFLGVHNEAIVDVEGFKWMIQTTNPVEVGKKIGMDFVPDAIHIMKKSSYSSEIGDYSTFSYEFYDDIQNDMS